MRADVALKNVSKVIFIFLVCSVDSFKLICLYYYQNIMSLYKHNRIKKCFLGKTTKWFLPLFSPLQFIYILYFLKTKKLAKSCFYSNQQENSINYFETTNCKEGKERKKKHGPLEGMGRRRLCPGWQVDCVHTILSSFIYFLLALAPYRYCLEANPMLLDLGVIFILYY